MADQAMLLALLRGLHMAATLSLLGLLGFSAWVAPVAGAEREGLVGVGAWRLSGLVALAAGVAWFILQSVTIAGTGSVTETAAVLPVVAMQTRYGNVMLMRAGLLLVATLLAGVSRWRVYVAFVVVAAALGLQGVTGHAGAIGGRLGAAIIGSECLHLLAAGLWLGALMPLWRCLGRLTAPAARSVCERFSPIGLACVLVIACSGLAQAMELVGSLPALLGTTYGRFVVLKIALFLVALALAALNRLWLTDRLGLHGSGAVVRLRWSVALEAVAGLAVILTAGLLASSVPAMHEAPVWPFSWQFSLDRWNDDADFRAELMVRLGLIGLAALLMVAAHLWGRFRVVALVMLAAALGLGAPLLRGLTVAAYPTSFQVSPTGFSAASIVRGQALFASNCAACHGIQGRGDGPLADKLPIRPADLTLPHLWGHSDGELFWRLTHGIEHPQGVFAMPGFPGLSEADRWALIDYVRAHNTALAFRYDTAQAVPVRAPGLPVLCAGSDASRFADLRGSVVHVVADGLAAQRSPIPPQLGIPVVTLEVRPDAAALEAPSKGSCVAAAPAAWAAYAVLAAALPEALAGTEFLVDSEGWLRAVGAPGHPGGWQTRDDLIAAVRGICANPIRQISGGEHEHHHD